MLCPVISRDRTQHNQESGTMVCIYQSKLIDRQFVWALALFAGLILSKTLLFFLDTTIWWSFPNLCFAPWKLNSKRGPPSSSFTGKGLINSLTEVSEPCYLVLLCLVIYTFLVPRNCHFSPFCVNVVERFGKQEWRSGESARLPPMWAWFDSSPVLSVGWVCCWFSLAPRVLLWVLRFSFLNKNQHCQIPIRSG